ncbi:MAG: Type III pantothenate kinase [Cryomorphaceae bacterium]|nr:MAG: Type III pantothenate kinase [Cryomorphaceae bacterium]
MKLIIDIGNTAVKAALFEAKQLITSTVFNDCTLQNILVFIGKQTISETIISSVKLVDSDLKQIIQYFDAHLLNESTLLPITIDYETPSTLGKDRIAALVGASFLFPNQDILVLDAGTCLTIDFINKRKIYKGGRISLGIAMRYKALNQFTSNLPLCEFSDSSMIMGYDTSSSIISGVQQGILAEVREIINIYKMENKDTIIIVTGGDCFFFETELKSSIFAYPFLIMEGLNEILDYNE